MISPYDFYYKKLSTEQVSNADLKRIFKQLENAPKNPGDHTLFDVYLKLSKSPNVDDDLIKMIVEKMIVSGTEKGVFPSAIIYLILDNGTKKGFDALWDEGPHEYKMEYWQSKHTDTKQLTEFYKEYFDNKAVPQLSSFQKFLRHPNISDDILHEVIGFKNSAYLWAMASNPEFTSKPKAFKYICVRVREHDPFGGQVDDILEQLLINTHLKWDVVADGIHLEDQIKTVFNTDAHSGVPIHSSSKRQRMIIEFCKRRECPDNIKEYMYERTHDDDFLPQAAKDIFLF